MNHFLPRLPGPSFRAGGNPGFGYPLSQRSTDVGHTRQSCRFADGSNVAFLVQPYWQ